MKTIIRKIMMFVRFIIFWVMFMLFIIFVDDKDRAIKSEAKDGE